MRRFKAPGRRPSVVRQRTQVDCGAACLATVSRFYGKRIRLARFHEHGRIGRSAMTLGDLQGAAEGFGFETLAAFSTPEHLKSSHLPAILNWQGRHWVVLFSWREGMALLGDPADGLLQLSEDEVLEGWNGYTLFLAPGDDFHSLEGDRPDLRRFLHYVKPHRRGLFELAAVSLLIQIMTLTLPIAARLILDEVILGPSAQGLNAIAIAATVCLAIYFCLSIARHWLLVTVSSSLRLRLARDLFRRLLELPMAFSHGQPVGALSARFPEANKLAEFLTSTRLQIFTDVATAVVYLGALLVASRKMALIVLFVFMVQILAGRAVSQRLRRSYREVYRRRAEASSLLIENLSGARTIQLLGLERTRRWLWEHALIRSVNASFVRLRASFGHALLNGTTRATGDVAILFFGALGVMAGEMSLGDLVFVQLIAAVLFQRLGALTALRDRYQDVLNAADQLEEVFSVPPETEPEGRKRRLPVVCGRLELEGVTVRYHDGAANVLQNLSLSIEPGQKVAVVGKSGCGKSTLIRLLLGFVPATSGKVYVDDFEWHEIDPINFRRQIGPVLQEDHLVEASVLENLRLAAPGSELEEVEEAARALGADDFIRALPDGYHTLIEPGNCPFSGGQKQRLLLVRCLLRRPRLLLLDEATSQLDPSSERRCLEELRRRLPESTIVIVSHRPEAIRTADQIFVLERGVLVEQGRHEQLIATGSLYRRLMSTAASSKNSS